MSHALGATGMKIKCAHLLDGCVVAPLLSDTAVIFKPEECSVMTLSGCVTLMTIELVPERCVSYSLKSEVR